MCGGVMAAVYARAATKEDGGPKRQPRLSVGWRIKARGCADKRQQSREHLVPLPPPARGGDHGLQHAQELKNTMKSFSVTVKVMYTHVDERSGLRSPLMADDVYEITMKDSCNQQNQGTIKSSSLCT